MSLILDALRKSERSRQQTLSGRVSASGSVLDHGRVPVPWATLIGLLLIANVIVLGIIFWRSHTSTPAPQPPVPVAVPAVAPPPVAPYRPAVRSLAAEAAAVGQNTALGQTVAGQPAVRPVSGAVSASTARKAAAVAVSAAPALAANTQVAASAAESTEGGNVPLLDTLPLAFQQSLPALHMDVHGYTRDPAGRFVVINMQRYTKGDTLAAGPTVVAIVPDGVILEYHGQKFLLPRP